MTQIVRRGAMVGIVVGAGWASACTAYDRDEYASLVAAASPAHLDGGKPDEGSGGFDGSDPVGDGGESAVDANEDAPVTDDGGAPICGPSVQQGSWVTIEHPSGTAPSPTGGEIVAGTYVLTAYRAYPSAPVTDGQVRETIQVTTTSKTTGTLAHLVERKDASGRAGPTGFVQTFRLGTADQTIVTGNVCPTTTLGDALYYSATPTMFAIVTVPLVREYTKVP
ncbi:hypothetical protein AKJ09_05940 [Labilithrix luteola]|uniref:Lipoprotein n=1 Tax=Labilithrix luteola TaxID=1391654 RepID=A0A0K1Q0X8_9BACT|nr:hypothetical protein [Labilithrix luteola]AKU99276.1 hypothetical protein AKJ09_05940 [Labilithrix luteola]